MRARRLITPVLASVASFGAAAGATAALSTGGAPRATAASATTTTGTGKTAGTTTGRTITTYQRYPKAPKGAKGDPGATGPSGAAGPAGIAGVQGPTGAAHILVTPVSINWQNNAWRGRETATFVAPGIGQGIITCRPNFNNGNTTDNGEQTITFTPFDQDMDTTMASVRTDDRPFTYDQNDDPYAPNARPIDVKFAHREQFTGPTFREGLNLKAFDPTYRAQGGMTGIISQRGRRGAIGGPVSSRPTTFRLTWHWNFNDGNPRCYVAGAFYTEAT